MSRRLGVSVAALVAPALVLAAAAAAGGPSPGLVQGSTGVTRPGQPLRYVTLTSQGTTTLVSISKASGRVVKWRTLHGQWGVPAVTFDGKADGLTRDGRTLAIADWVQPENNPLRDVSQFQLVDTKSLLPQKTISLRGEFSFDALSPDGKTLYLIQHGSTEDASRYLVRAYDLDASRLLPKVVADPRQADWVMRGFPMKRATSADGRWVYTLYRQDGGYPFVHALDAVGRSAICIGIPWQGNQDPLARAQLRIDEGHGELTIAAGGRAFAIDTETFRVSLPGPSGGFSTALLASSAAGLFALGVVTLTVRRRQRARPNQSIEGLSA
jgi:hypothetical protein